MSTPQRWRTTASYKATEAHLRKVLGGFSPSYDETQLSERMYMFQVPASKLPMAVLAREVMVVFSAENLGRQDKVEWRYGFTVDGVLCVLASTKWGLRLYVDAAVGDGDAAEQLAERVLDKLAAAQRVVNKSVLQPRLADQIKVGNVTITNQYAQLRDGYKYFREGAERAYARKGRLDPDNFLVDLIAGAGSQEAWWNTLAMVQAYFSMLEHVLIGCLPFTSFDPTTEDLSWVIGEELTKKMQRLMNIGSDPEAARQFNALRNIAVRFRNTYSHGAFGSKGEAAMFVHLPDVGAVPVTLGEFGVRTELLFVPAVKDDFESICAVFDSCDEWLANGPLADGHKWILEGLDFRFDAKFRADLADARSKGHFDQFLEASSYQMDAAMNMDVVMNLGI
jgi:hypothetical protein